MFTLQRRIFDEEHEMLRESVQRFLADQVQPHLLQEWDDAGIIPRELYLKFGEQGLLAPQTPLEFGGPGGDFRSNAVVIEEVAYSGLSAAAFSVHSDIAAGYVLRFGTDDQKREWLPRMVSGEAIGAIAMTEPGAGSDLQAMRTSAVRDGDDYVINGSKTFITSGHHADLAILAARTDTTARGKGISLFLVEASRHGYRKGRRLKKIGLRHQDTAELHFDNVRVPATNLLGVEGSGFAQLMQELPQERLSVAVGAVAATRRAFDLTVDYVTERKAFQRRVAEFQNTRFELAAIKAELTVAQLYLDECIDRHLRAELTAEDAAIAKLWTTEFQGRSVDRCLQLFGGYGYMSEYLISRIYVDARVQRIYGGTSEIMKEIIARSIFGKQ